MAFSEAYNKILGLGYEPKTNLENVVEVKSQSDLIKEATAGFMKKITDKTEALLEGEVSVTPQNNNLPRNILK